MIFIIAVLVGLGDAMNTRKQELGEAIKYFVGSLVNALIVALAAAIDGAIEGLLGYDLGLRDALNQDITLGVSSMKPVVKTTTLDKIANNKDMFEDFRDAGGTDGVLAAVGYKTGFSSSLNDAMISNLGNTGADSWMKNSLLANPISGPAQLDLSGLKVEATDIDTSDISSDLQTEMATLGTNSGYSFNSGLLGGLEMPEGALDEYVGNFNYEEQLKELGNINATEFDAGMYEGMFDGDVEGWSNQIIDQMNMPNEYQDTGSEDAKSFIRGLEENRNPIRRKAIQIAAGAVDEFDSKKIEFFSAGLHAMDGFIEGIQWKMDEVRNVVLEAANMAKRAFSGKDGLDEHSPSKVFMTYGEYASEGFIVGLTSYADRITESSSAVANSAVDALKTPLQHITDIIDGTLDVDPTIRPVMDLTDIQNGSQMIDGMFADRSVQLAGINNKLNGLNVDANLRDKKSANNDIVEELRTLRSGFADMSQRLDNMQVVIDSGQLVGAISAPMDRSLGNRSIRKGRRN